jgi:stage II sporulation protein AA (anti-sigma F factor antagonist)
MVEVPSEPTPGHGRPPAQAPRDVFRVSVSRAVPDLLVVQPCGEVDLASAAILRDAVIDAVEEHPRRVSVDLSGLSFCGSAGLAALVEARRAAADAGVGFAVVNPQLHVRRVIKAARLRGYLALRERPDHAR